MTPKQAIAFLNKSKRISLTDGKTMANERIVGVFECNQGVFSSNGHILHLWKGDYTGDVNPGREGNDKYADATRSMGKQIAVISVTKKHLKRAIKACRAFKPNTISVNANTKLQLQATGDNGSANAVLENTDVWRLGKRAKKTTVLYRHVGQDHSFSINPKYLYDAVMGMDSIIIIQVMESGLKFHSELAEAWVMYMYMRD